MSSTDYMMFLMQLRTDLKPRCLRAHVRDLRSRRTPAEEAAQHEEVRRAPPRSMPIEGLSSVRLPFRCVQTAGVLVVRVWQIFSVFMDMVAQALSCVNEG